MTRDEFYSNVKKKAIYAADKINQTADLATLQVKLSLAEHKLNEAYAELGRVAYQHFLSEDSQADHVANAMKPVEEAIANVESLKQAVEAAKAKTTDSTNNSENTDNPENGSKA